MTERFGYLTQYHPDLGGYSWSVFEIYDDKPVLRVVSGAHYGTSQLAELAGQRVWARVMRVAERYGMTEVAA